MKCPRCEGFMVRDHFYDPDGPFLRIETLRCLNCGETVYPKTVEQSASMPDEAGEGMSLKLRKTRRMEHQGV